MQETHYETDQRTFTKRVSIDLTPAGVTATPTQIVYRPPHNTRFVLIRAIVENKEVVGTVTDAPAVILDNGTDAGAIVATTDLALTQGVAKVLTLAAVPLILDYDHPLRLKSGDGADGATKFRVNLVIELLKLSA